MNFGQNLYNWFLSNAQSLVLMAIAVIGVYLGFKREFSKLIGFLVQFAPHGGHWCVCQRPPGGAQRPPSLRYFDRLNNNNVMLRCPLHNSVG